MEYLIYLIVAGLVVSTLLLIFVPRAKLAAYYIFGATLILTAYVLLKYGLKLSFLKDILAKDVESKVAPIEKEREALREQREDIQEQVSHQEAILRELKDRYANNKDLIKSSQEKLDAMQKEKERLDNDISIKDMSIEELNKRFADVL